MGTASNETTITRRASVAICGNPNCGKTTIFNAITGLRQRVGNYPGVTVEKIYGQFSLPAYPQTEFTVIDIPGSYSLSAFSPDEYIAAQTLFGSSSRDAQPDVVICLIDATNIERGLYLLFQVMQIGVPVVVGLNMIDLVEKRGNRVDCERLSARLGGIPVVELVGPKGRGIEQLLTEVGQAVGRDGKSALKLNDVSVETAVGELISKCDDQSKSKAEYFRILFDDGGPAQKEFCARENEGAKAALGRIRKRLVEEYSSLTYAETLSYSRFAEDISGEVVNKAVMAERGLSGRLDRLLLHRWLGPAILVVLMTLMFQSIFSWAEPIMGLVDMAIGAVAHAIEANMEVGPLRSLLTDGVVGGVGSVLIFLPQIVILFVFIAFLEDSGYMTRAAFLVDRAFNWCGLSGKSFIPMLSSFACAVPGIMATRTIEDRRLRLVTMFVAPLMSCSARLPVYTIMIAAFVPSVSYFGIFNSQGILLTALYLLGIVVAIIVSYVLKKTIYKSEPSSFIMEMPTYKLPNFRSVVMRVANRAKSFVLRAGTVILAITIIIWALGYYPHSAEITERYESEKLQLLQSIRDARITAGENIDPNSDPANWVLTESERSEISLIDNRAAGAHLRNSYFAQAGQVIEPLFRPLGWDWRITMSVMASFPAREVIIATLGTIFNLGADVDQESWSLIELMRASVWDSGERIGKPLFSPAVALSIMVFFALSCQCGATLVSIKQEAGAWKYSVFVFVYMTVLGYVGAWAVYQLAMWFGLGV